MEKKLNLEQGRLRVEYPAADIEVWAMDEHRLGRARLCNGVFGPGKENNQLLLLNGVSNGYGCMASFILNREKLIGGSSPKLISTYSIEFWQISHNILVWVRISASS
jgi:hypothetical protein